MTTSNTRNGRPSTDLTPAPAPPQQVGADRRAHNDPGYPSVQSHPVQTNSGTSPHSYLPRSPLIGRDHDVAFVRHLLQQEHVGLLTLAGPGGIGKTRLALQVATTLIDDFVDGVYVVPLAPIRDAELVGLAIAQALDVREASGRSLLESLQAYLEQRQLLLLLDNFEQVLAAAPLLATLLARCQRLKILVTSRATLHLYGEQEYAVPPLTLPDAKRLAASGVDHVTHLAQVAAVELFVQRAVAVKPDFALTTSNARAVSEICIGLDGLPLAIELAAAKVKLFSPLALQARLQQRLTLLTNGPNDLPERQRTLRAEIAWSYDLLTAHEQTLFQRFAVFVGGFTLTAAEAIGSALSDQAVDVLEGITRLLDQNLLKQVEQSDGEPRFGMLETIRDYGLERLTASGEAEMIRRQHAEFFMAFAEATEPEMLGAQREQGLARLQAELDNLRAALIWSQTHAPQDDMSRSEIGLRLAGALTWFAHFGNHVHEARGWLMTSLQHSAASRLPTTARAKALWGVGLMAAIQGDYEIAHTQLKESEALWRRIGDQGGLAFTLRELCLVTYSQGDYSAAQRFGDEGVTLCRALGYTWHLALALDNLAYVVAAQGDTTKARTLIEEEFTLFHALNDAWGLAGAIVGLGSFAYQQGDYSTARAHFETALAIRRAKADNWTMTETLALLGEVLHRQGELQQASNLFRECLRLAYEIGDKAGMAHVLHHLATLELAHKNYVRATCLFAVAAKMRNLTGGLTYHTFVDRTAQERQIAQVRTLLGNEVFATKWAEGEAMQPQVAIDYALMQPEISELGLLHSEPNPIPQPKLAHTNPAGLTTRELEVLQLLGQGLTYAQIADKLVISRRTVNGHLTSLYSKLDVTSRAAATRFAIDNHLV